ncbi:MAG: polysaccharide deacetylase family protein, partial [Desulfobacula sp.]|nr:polysaccharide deacetylase family protein [Desulfobacula sp.]
MKKQTFIMAIIFLCLSCIIACIPQKKSMRPHITLKSDHFILCTLTRDESPLLLARQFLNNTQNAWMIEDANPNAQYKSGETIIIPLKIQNKAGLFSDGFQVVPILCYHRFAKTCTSQLCMPEDVFTDQMLFLKNNNYRVISLQMLFEFLTYDKAIPKNSVVITIDDGYRSVYDVAWPILKKLGFTATLFIYNDFIGGGSALTWDEIREMKAGGFEIGSHTLSHADLTLKKKGETHNGYINRITQEIFESKKILDLKLNQDTRFFAY